MSRVSVIIPTYNRAHLLPFTIRSILQQTRQVDEIIVIDDGSTDDTRDVLKQFGDVVVYLHQVNQYLGAARNRGQRQATGDLLLFLDSDDLLLPDAIRRMEDPFRSMDDVVLVYGDAICFSDSGVAELPDLPRPSHPNWSVFIQQNCIRTAGCALIRRSALESVGPWDVSLRGNEDWDMWLRLTDLGCFYRLPEPVLRYRLHQESMSQVSLEMQISSLLLRRKHFERSYPDLSRRKLAAQMLKITEDWLADRINSDLGSALKGLRLQAAWRNARLLFSLFPFTRAVRLQFQQISAKLARVVF